MFYSPGHSHGASYSQSSKMDTYTDNGAVPKTPIESIEIKTGSAKKKRSAIKKKENNPVDEN